WIPNIDDILERTPEFSDGPNMVKSYRVQHPLLLEDGGLVFTSGAGPMVKINRCSVIEWVLVHKFHHSIELDHQGNIVTCSKIDGDGPDTVLPIRDDAIAVVSPEGTLIDEYSIAKILLDNGHRTLIYGIGRFEHNRIHLNDAHPIIEEAGIAETGDVLISSRHLSTVGLVEPESSTIKWLKTGPWLNQHDINLLPDGRYSIFGNDMVRGYNKTGNVLVEKGVSDIYIYDPATDTVTQPYSAVMRAEKIGSLSQGRSRVLANGDVYIEQTDSARLLRISDKEVRWEYVNAVSENTVGALHWSRYLTDKEVNLRWLNDLICK
ncbi:MAG: arylsulfotransferase family protein, partial [Desulfofustis sp.]|nr:arylsulfotransferase family protein [Desulfofustis sp.]